MSMAIVEEPLPQTSEAGWMPDPEGRHNLRFFDGNQWTDHVTHFGPTPCVGCTPDTATMAGQPLECGHQSSGRA